MMRKSIIESNRRRAGDPEVVAGILKSGNWPVGLKINLENCFLGDWEWRVRAIAAIAEALKSGNCPVGLQIYLKSNHIHGAEINPLAEALASGNCPVGLQIYLQSNRIRDIKALAKALAGGNCPVGLQIDLSENLIDDEGAEALAEALASGNCPVGLRIDLRGNQIGAKGAKALAEALKSGKCPAGLHVLLQPKKKIGVRAGKVIVEAFAAALVSGRCPVGLRINLEGHDIGDAGAEVLAKAIASGRCPVDLQIDLEGNPIGLKGAKAILEALKSGYCPDGLHIEIGWHGRVDFGVSEEVREAMKICRDNFLKRATAFIEGKSQVSSCVSQLPAELIDFILEKAGFHVSTIEQAYKMNHQIAQQQGNSSSTKPSKTNSLECKESLASASREDSLVVSIPTNNSTNYAKKRINSSAADDLPPAKRRRIENDEQDLMDDGWIDTLQPQEYPSSVAQNIFDDNQDFVGIPANSSLPCVTQTNPASFFLQAVVHPNNAATQTRTMVNSQAALEPVTPGLFSPFSNQN